ncbi:hypothetical protein PFISCL1PPCAC_19104, partial [Pristionchus fissidentatus]
YLVIGGLSPIALRGVIPQLLETEGTTKVVIYDNLNNGHKSFAPVLSTDKRVSVVVGSTFNEKLLQKTLTDNEITHVIDFASLSSPRETSPIAIARTAVVGFTHVLDAVRHYGKSPRFVLVSRELTPSRSLSESVPPLPNSMIAANSMAVESMLHSYVVSYRLPLMIARLSEGVIVHGLSRGLNAVFDGVQVEDEKALSLISLADASRGILAVLNKGEKHQIYNIGGEIAVMLKDLKECYAKIKEGSCCTVPSIPSVFPIDKAQIELGWTPVDKDPCAVLKSELAVISTPRTTIIRCFRKVLVYGFDQPTGVKVIKVLKSMNIVFALGSSKPGEDSMDKVKEEIFGVAPSHIIFVGDLHSDPAYFDQDPKPAKLKENVGKNLHAPWILAAICERIRCTFGYIQTFKEQDVDETSEGVVKSFTNRLLEQFSSDYQCRFVVPESAMDERNVVQIVVNILTKNENAPLAAAKPEEGKTCNLS